MVRVADRQLADDTRVRGALTRAQTPDSIQSTIATDWPLPETVEVLGFRVADLHIESLIELMIERAAAGLPTNVAYLNAHTANLAAADPAFASALQSSDVLYADGMSVVWAAQLLARRRLQRMTAADYFTDFAARCARRGLSLYLLGGHAEIAQRAADKLTSEIPTLRIAGFHTGYIDEGEPSVRLIDQINDSNADALILGMGSPRQERWLAENAPHLRPPLRWCVGALFDYLAGREPRAPRWLCQLGGEWFFRLLTDPRGKWHRYLVGNPQFAWRVLCAASMTHATKPG